MEQELLQEFVNFIKTASPVIWQSLLKQSYIDGVSNIIWAVLLLTLSVAVYKFARHILNHPEEFDNTESTAGIIYVLQVVITLVALIVLNDGIGFLINPEYHAIHLILQTFK